MGQTLERQLEDFSTCSWAVNLRMCLCKQGQKYGNKASSKSYAIAWEKDWRNLSDVPNIRGTHWIGRRKEKNQVNVFFGMCFSKRNWRIRAKLKFIFSDASFAPGISVDKFIFQILLSSIWININVEKDSKKVLSSLDPSVRAEILFYTFPTWPWTRIFD